MFKCLLWIKGTSFSGCVSGLFLCIVFVYRITMMSHVEKELKDSYFNRDGLSLS